MDVREGIALRYGSSFDDLMARLSQGTRGSVSELVVPRLSALVASEEGPPGGLAFRTAIDAVRTLSAAVESVINASVRTDDTASGGRPVEAVFMSLGRTGRWSIRIPQPDLVTVAVVETARIHLAAGGRLVDGVRLAHFDEGLCVQTRFDGSPREGVRVVGSLLSFAHSRGYELAERRHEIYLPPRSRDEEQGLILRYPIELRHR